MYEGVYEGVSLREGPKITLRSARARELYTHPTSEVVLAVGLAPIPVGMIVPSRAFIPQGCALIRTFG